MTDNSQQPGASEPEEQKGQHDPHDASSQREKRLAELRHQYQDALASNNWREALDGLEESIQILLDDASGRGSELERLVKGLLSLRYMLDREDAQLDGERILADIRQLVRQDPGLGRLSDKAGCWFDLAGRYAMMRFISRMLHLGQLEIAYRTACELVRKDDSVASLTLLGESVSALTKSLDGWAIKLLERAQCSVDGGDYDSAINDLLAIEQDVYLPVQKEFPNLLCYHEESERLREESVQLLEQAHHLKEVSSRALPCLHAARHAYLDGKFEQALEQFRQFELEDALGELVVQNREAVRLRQTVVRAFLDLLAAASVQELDPADPELWRYVGYRPAGIHRQLFDLMLGLAQVITALEEDAEGAMTGLDKSVQAAESLAVEVRTFRQAVWERQKPRD